MKKGTILITLGLLLITAALCLVGYNYYESYKAGKASDSVLEELEQAIASETGEGSGDGISDSSASNAEGGSEDGSGDSAGNAGQVSSGSGDSGEGTGAGEGIYDYESEISDVNMGELYPDRDMPSISVQEIGYAGYIFIPSLSIRLPVQSEWVYDLLTVSPARYSGSVYKNNLVIGGHSYITHFRGLRGITPGAKVIFYDAEGFSYEYEVSYVMTLNPDQGAVLLDEESEDWDLTLFTCNTGGQTRCIVRCVRTEY